MNGPIVGNRKLSVNKEKARGSSMMDRANAGGSVRAENYSTALVDGGKKQTLDVQGYRGNLYKQTLSPSWSKSRLREA